MSQSPLVGGNVLSPIGWLALAFIFSRLVKSRPAGGVHTPTAPAAPPTVALPKDANTATVYAAMASQAPEPWPQVIPSTMPPFPGAEWTPDVPPPPEVAGRAAQLLSRLWASGEGTHTIEQTGGRWIAYQATRIGGKKGVVAHRLRNPGVTSAPRVVMSEPQSRVVAVSSPVAPRATTVPAAPPVSATTALPTLAKGARGPDVVTLQRSFGWGKVTDFFGSQTEAEVKKRQAAAGLPTTGVVDARTWGALLGRGTAA